MFVSYHISMTNTEALKKRARSLGVRVTKSVNGRWTPKTENELRRHVEMAERKRENAKRETAAKRHGGGWLRNPFTKRDKYPSSSKQTPYPIYNDPFEDVGKPYTRNPSEDSKIIMAHFKNGLKIDDLDNDLRTARSVQQDGDIVSWDEGMSRKSLNLKTLRSPNNTEI